MIVGLGEQGTFSVGGNIPRGIEISSSLGVKGITEATLAWGGGGAFSIGFLKGVKPDDKRKVLMARGRH